MVALIDHKTRMEVSSVQTFNLYVLGDIHIGARGCDMEAFERDVDEVARDPFGYAIFMGDLVDGIWLSDPRFDLRDIHPHFKTATSEVDTLIHEEVAYFCDVASKIPKDRILAVLTGNHEEKVATWMSKQGIKYDPHYEICSKLGAKSADYCGFVRWKFIQTLGHKETKGIHSHVIIIFAHHGYGGGRTSGGHAQALQHTLDSHEADLLLFGHRHQSLADPKVRLTIPRRGKLKLIHRTMKATHTGTYLKTWQEGHANYAAKMAYKATHIGMRRIRVQPRSREIVIEV